MGSHTNSHSRRGNPFRVSIYIYYLTPHSHFGISKRVNAEPELTTQLPGVAALQSWISSLEAV